MQTVDREREKILSGLKGPTIWIDMVKRDSEGRPTTKVYNSTQTYTKGEDSTIYIMIMEHNRHNTAKLTIHSRFHPPRNKTSFDTRW